MIDSREIEELHPCLQRGVEELRRRLKEKMWTMGVSSTYRDNTYQNYLYSLGRDLPGQIVTNAKGGESIHNYRLAFDIFNNVSSQLYPVRFLGLAGEIWEEMGGEWGGSWSHFPDKPHFQFTGGRSLSYLQTGVTLDKKMRMSWEEREEIDTLNDAFTEFNQWAVKFDYEYWKSACKYVNYLEDLFITIANQLNRFGNWDTTNNVTTLAEAFEKFEDKGIAFDYEYWRKACQYVRFLEPLFIKIANQL